MISQRSPELRVYATRDVLSFKATLNCRVYLLFLMSSQQDAVQAGADAYVAAHQGAFLFETDVMHQYDH